MSTSNRERNMNSSTDEINHIKAGEVVGTLGILGAQRPDPEVTFSDWVEAGGMSDVPLQPGEAGWISYKLGCGPRAVDMPAADVTGRVVPRTVL